MDEGGGVPGHLRVHGRIDDGIAHLRLAGEVDLASAQAVRQVVGEALDEGVREVVIDLTPVTFLDSTGLSVLLHAARDASRRGAAVRSLSAPGAEARLVIELAGVSSLLGLEEPDHARQG
jgi:anti-sigma B factor antagonist